MHVKKIVKNRRRRLEDNQEKVTLFYFNIEKFSVFISVMQASQEKYKKRNSG